MTALPAPPDEQVRALAVTILKRSEFAFWHDTPWLISFLAWLSGLWETNPVLYYAMLVGLVAVALLLLAHVTWAVRRALAVAPPARVLELGRSDPNRTLRRRLRDAALPEAERGDLLALIDWLEQRWFRDRSEERELYDRWRSLHARLGAVLKPA